MTRRPWLLMCLLLSGCAAMCGDTIPPGTVGLLVDNMAGGNNPKAIEVKPGQMVEVESRDPAADAVRLVGKGRAALTIGTRAASKLLVEVPTVR